MKDIKNYKLINQESLPDLRSEGSLLIHEKSGARIMVLENNDENKVFYIGFRTPPIDSCGTAHITEHSVLCGSEKYPIKDPFVELAKGSMNTFLNAMTYPDKTVYPIASTNDKDFANLMDVYMDAVLHPNISKHPEIFAQEGWHYELEEPDGELSINGVVYNEMKGAFSSPDDVLSRAILNSLFPDTTYGFESGGDPDDIPKLTYEAFLDFHARYYHPCNSYIYLYGDMDVEERLAWLDEEYLSHYDRIDLDSKVMKQNPFAAPLRIEQDYPIASGDDEEDATYLSYNLVIGDVLDQKLYGAFEILDYALLSAPGAPLRKALVDAGIGADILGGYDNGTLQPVFSVIAKGTNADREEEFLQIIRDVFRQQANGGLDHTSLLAAINATGFKIREADFGGYPKGLMYGLNALDSWLYADDEPFMHLKSLAVLDELKGELDGRYFEELIEKYLLDNSHASIVVVKPKKGMTQQKEDELKRALAEYKASLSDEEIDELIRQSAHLKEYQMTPSTPEELLTLPLLERSDLKKEAHPFCHTVKVDKDGNEIVYSELDTNGVGYINLMFELGLDELASEMELALFCHILGFVDTENYSYADFANEVNLYTGGLATSPKLYVEEGERIREFVEVRMKYLYENEDKAFELLEEMLFASDFSDKKRIKEILMQEYSGMQMRLMSAGHTLSAFRAGSYYADNFRRLDEVSGIAYYEYLKDFADSFDKRADEFIERCKKFCRWLFAGERLIIAPICEGKAYPSMMDRVEKLKARLYDDKGEDVKSVPAKRHRNEGITTAAQVQYVSKAGSFKGTDMEYTGAFKVLKVLLNYDYFWLNIRVSGGAYGCMSQMTRSKNILFSSYRDPNLESTVDVFDGTADYLSGFSADERDMRKYVIGAISSMDTPLSPSAEGMRSLTAYITGTTIEQLQKERDQVLSCEVEDIRSLAPMIRRAMEENNICTIGNEANIKASADLFEEVRNL